MWAQVLAANLSLLSCLAQELGSWGLLLLTKGQKLEDARSLEL